MTSPLPPRLRDTRSIEDRIRQDRTNLGQLRVGFMGGRYSPLRPLGAAALFGEIEADEESDGESEQEYIRFCNTDSLQVAALGTVTMTLTYEPIPESLQIWWGTLPQPPTEWSLDGSVVTIPDPNGLIHVGDVFNAYYAYENGGFDFDPTGPIDWTSTGPYRVLGEGDMTNYSSPSLDDSTWSSDAAPVGYPMGINSGQPTWPGVTVGTLTPDHGIWLRRHLTTLTDTLSISARVDGQWWLYCDGVLIASNPTHDATAQVGPYAVNVSPGDHVVALHVNDDTIDPSGEGLYADLKIGLS